MEGADIKRGGAYLAGSYSHKFVATTVRLGLCSKTVSVSCSDLDVEVQPQSRLRVQPLVLARELVPVSWRPCHQFALLPHRMQCRWRSAVYDQACLIISDNDVRYIWGFFGECSVQNLPHLEKTPSLEIQALKLFGAVSFTSYATTGCLSGHTYLPLPLMLMLMLKWDTRSLQSKRTNNLRTPG